MTTEEILTAAVKAKPMLSVMSDSDKNKALNKMAERLAAETDTVLAANKTDIDSSRGKVSDVMLDRLTLTAERIRAMAESIKNVALLPDPVGMILSKETLPNGLTVEKRSVPFGVIAIIFESRPNVTSDAAALCFKSGNCCILRGGKDAINSNKAIVSALKNGLAEAGADPDTVSLITDTSRESANRLMTANGYVDLLIPRGGKGLISACVNSATVPCIETGTGICHIYVDRAADLSKALDIIENAKTSRPSVCNAEEVLLVHRDIADEFLPMLKKRLTVDRIASGKTPVELRLDGDAARIISGTPAGDGDFDTEFLDYILAVGVVDGTDSAIRHISKHSTGHSDAIITEDKAASDKFTSLVDSAAVYVNASTRFTDGGEFGFGCEIGISTQKLHARGPMGLKEMTAYKYIVTGNGHIR